MLRMRKNDTYISGLWKSSLLGDLTWRCGDTRFQREPRSAARIPSWSWTSTRGAVQYTSHNNLTLALSVDSSYDPGISLEQGYPDGVAVVLKCHSCAGWIRWTKSSSPYRSIYFTLSEEDLAMPPPDQFWRIRADYDFETGSEPVQFCDDVVVALIEWDRMDGSQWGGLVLRQVSQGNYERIGWCFMDSNKSVPFVSRKAKLKDNFHWRYFRQFVTSLPVRSFRIV